MGYLDQYESVYSDRGRNERMAEQIRKGQIPKSFFAMPTPEENAAAIAGKEAPLPPVASQVPDIRTPNLGAGIAMPPEAGIEPAARHAAPASAAPMPQGGAVMGSEEWQRQNPQPGSPAWFERYPESAGRLQARPEPAQAQGRAEMEPAGSSYLRVAFGGDEPQTWTPGSMRAPAPPGTRTMGGIADRSYRPRPNAFSGMVGGIQTQGQLDQDAKAEGQFNDRWNARAEQVDEEEQRTADVYLNQAKNQRDLQLLQEDPVEAYMRRLNAQRSAKVGEAVEIEAGKQAVQAQASGASEARAQLEALRQKLIEGGATPEEMRSSLNQFATDAARDYAVKNGNFGPWASLVRAEGAL